MLFYIKINIIPKYFYFDHLFAARKQRFLYLIMYDGSLPHPSPWPIWWYGAVLFQWRTQVHFRIKKTFLSVRDFCHSTFWRAASSAPFLFNFLLKIYTNIKKSLLPRGACCAGQPTVCDSSSTRCTVTAPWLSQTSPSDLEPSRSIPFFHGSPIPLQLNPKTVPLLLLIILSQN